MQIKLVASDVDGTIINEAGVVSEKTIQAVKALKNKGIHFVIATGRSFEGAKSIIDQIGLEKDDYGIICLNGLRTYYADKDEFTQKETMTFEDCKQFEAIGKKYYLGILYCFDDHAYFQMDEKTYKDYTISLDERKMRYFRSDMESNSIQSLDEIKHRFEANDPILKIVYIQSDDFMDLIINRVKKEFPHDYKCLQVGRGWTEIMPTSVNKGEALKQYAQARGISTDEIMAFGDAENDIDMLQTVKYSFAVANAMDTVKAVASDVTKSNTEDGVAVAIEKYVLNQ